MPPSRGSGSATAVSKFVHEKETKRKEMGGDLLVRLDLSLSIFVNEKVTAARPIPTLIKHDHANKTIYVDSPAEAKGLKIPPGWTAMIKLPGEAAPAYSVGWKTTPTTKFQRALAALGVGVINTTTVKAR